MTALEPIRIALARKILLLWIVSEIAFVGSFFVLEHEPVKLFLVVNYSIQWLLFLLCVAIVRHEPVKKNKHIFLNFALFFSISLLFHIYNFVGKTFFADQQFARFYFNQYVSYGAYFFFLAFAIVYLCLDALFRDFKSLYKYALALAIVGGIFAYYYHGYAANPRYLYSTDDAKTWKALDDANRAYVKDHGVEPSLQTLAEITDLKLWNEGQPIGTLYPDEKLRRVTEVYPYLSGTNYIVFLQGPLYMNTIYMCILCLAFILLYFGYQYMKDPPQGAYIDKIMFLFLIFCTMEIMHAWSFIKSVEWQSFYELLNVGHAVSLCILLFIALFFALRLRFIRTVKGEFYEHEILVSPGSITRWRDALDDLLVAHFFNRKAILGRLFLKSSDKS
ncbi:MAG: hypothetical protein AABZ61_08060 [Bacteroidota bacterium]